MSNVSIVYPRSSDGTHNHGAVAVEALAGPVETAAVRAMRLEAEGTLVSDGCLWLGGSTFLDVAVYADGSATMRLSADSAAEQRFEAGTVQAHIAHIVAGV